MPSIRALLLVALPLVASSAPLIRRVARRSADTTIYTDDRLHVSAALIGDNGIDDDSVNDSANDTANISYTLAPTPAPVTMPGPDCCGPTCTPPEHEHKYFTINPCPTAACGEKHNILVDECNTAAVVCCEEHEPGNVSVYQMSATSNQCWGVSTDASYLAGNITYQPDLTYKQAENQCTAFGQMHTPPKNVRLCSMAEILEPNITGCNSGCEYDCDFVWVSDQGPCHRSEYTYHGEHGTTGVVHDQLVGRCLDKDGNFLADSHLYTGWHSCCDNHGVSLGHFWNTTERCKLPAHDPGRHLCNDGGNGDPAHQISSNGGHR